MSETKTSSKLNPELIQFLEDSDSYFYGPESVEHIQTHISHVFIAAPFVYKIKKPVNFDFLDFSSLDKREYYCKREVELNRRLCEDIYLGVVSIASVGSTFKIEADNESSIVEYAVKMRKLNEEYFLPAFIERGELTLQHLDRVAEKLAAFYLGQAPKEEILKWGGIEKVRFNTDENFRQTKPFIGDTIDKNSYRAIKEYTDQYYDRFDYLFRRRIEEKRIVDGHGDLHLEHIHITPEKVRIYDCIEFNNRFRFGDTAVDLAYLAMDLDFAGCRKEERYFLEKMSQQLQDPDLLAHVDFYKCYRAYVKGKVKSLQAGEEEVEKKDRKTAIDKAREYFDLSLRYALLGSRPTVLIFMGRIATGKSTLAEAFSNKLGLDHFSSDRIRKQLMGVPLEERTDASRREQMYSRDMSLKTYKELRSRAEEYIEARNSVILDATYSREEDRSRLVELLESVDAAYYFVEVRASDELITERLKARESEERVVSDARLEDFEKLIQHYQPPEELSSNKLIGVDTERSKDESLYRLYRKLIEGNLEMLNNSLLDKAK